MDFLREHKRKFIGLGLLLLIAAAFAIFWRLRPDPRVAEARELGKQMRNTNLSADQRRALGKQLRDKVQQLSPAQRRQLFGDRRKAMRERMAGYFKKPRREQIAQLDEDINRMEQFRRQGQQNGGFGAAGR